MSVMSERNMRYIRQVLNQEIHAMGRREQSTLRLCPFGLEDSNNGVQEDVISCIVG